MANILIIDDDLFIRDVLADNAEVLGHVATTAGTLSRGLTLLNFEQFDLVFLDVRLPDGNGIEALSEIRRCPSNPEIIIITGVGDAEGAELAIRSGVWDYIQKPFSKQEIRLQMERALEYRQNKSQSRRTVSLKRDTIIGNSLEINACLDRIAQCADSDTNVLITGETGTGKELFARVVHDNSARAEKQFVVVDCTALPEQLVESLLFGHDRGAFTGADRSRKGLIAEADGGTLFLDEVGELPLSIQSSFLRVLQEHRFRPVGMGKEIKSNFRLISATNRNLDDMTASGRFRQDLLYRLRTFQIELPPLRVRKEDIHDLTLFYTRKVCRKTGTEMKGMTPEYVKILENHDWPGNVRELFNTLEAAVLADQKSPMLFPMHLPAKIRLKNIRNAIDRKSIRKKDDNVESSLSTLSSSEHNRIPDFSGKPPSLKKYRETIIEDAEKNYLFHLMENSRGDIQVACRISQLSQSRLYYLLKKYNISRHGKQ